MDINYGLSLWNFFWHNYPDYEGGLPELKNVMADIKWLEYKGVELWRYWKGQDLFDPDMAKSVCDWCCGLPRSLRLPGRNDSPARRDACIQASRRTLQTALCRMPGEGRKRAVETDCNPSRRIGAGRPRRLARAASGVSDLTRTVRVRSQKSEVFNPPSVLRRPPSVLRHSGSCPSCQWSEKTERSQTST